MKKNTPSKELIAFACTSITDGDDRRWTMKFSKDRGFFINWQKNNETKRWIQLDTHDTKEITTNHFPFDDMVNALIDQSNKSLKYEVHLPTRDKVTLEMIDALHITYNDYGYLLLAGEEKGAIRVVDMMNNRSKLFKASNVNDVLKIIEHFEQR
ncbi:hypothetical protein [Ureaplasma canigenitalium]|uniref:hypothetical protein n=1 Tax=Ureaplasma canigenitalium TaxID=42092 RepID=UPI0004E0C421|nr:hypothetical protein [Ureaplasma canigenitalium]